MLRLFALVPVIGHSIRRDTGCRGAEGSETRRTTKSLQEPFIFQPANLQLENTKLTDGPFLEKLGTLHSR